MEALVTLVLAHKWIALTAVLAGAVVRATKEDTIIPVDVPARWRPLLAFALGQASAVLEHLAAGAPWGRAVVDGLVASIVAILGHEWIVERLLGDRAMPIPGLTKKTGGTSGTTAKLPSPDEGVDFDSTPSTQPTEEAKKEP